MAHHCAHCGIALKGDQGSDFVRSGWTNAEGRWIEKSGARYCMPRNWARCDRRAKKTRPRRNDGAR